MTTFISLGSEIRRLSFLLCIFFVANLCAQHLDDPFCITDQTQGPQGISYSYGTSLQNLNSFEPLVINIFY